MPIPPGNTSVFRTCLAETGRIQRLRQVSKAAEVEPSGEQRIIFRPCGKAYGPELSSGSSIYLCNPYPHGEERMRNLLFKNRSQAIRNT